VDYRVAGEKGSDRPTGDLGVDQGLGRKTAQPILSRVANQNDPALLRQIRLENSTVHVGIVFVHESKHFVALGRRHFGHIDNLGN
jgi:hypothetical protein